MKNKQLVENILKHVGGTANIATRGSLHDPPAPELKGYLTG